jgi:hypothetical protein
LTAEGEGKKDVISAWKANQSANATAIKRGGEAKVEEILKKMKAKTASPEEIQALANYTSTGKGNLIYSKEGEVIDKNTGEVVLGFNDTSKGQGYVNVGNGAATNVLTFMQTDAEERAHNHTSNESIAKGAAASELFYYNVLSWATGGETINAYNSGGWGNSQQVWNEKYNTSNNELLWNNTFQASLVSNDDKAYLIKEKSELFAVNLVGGKTSTKDNANYFTNNLTNFSTNIDNALPVAQVGVDLLSAAPVVGIPFDVLSFKISEYQNDEAGMALSIIGLDPQYVGLAAGMTKVVKDIAKNAKAGTKLAEALTKDGAGLAETALKMTNNEVKAGSKLSISNSTTYYDFNTGYMYSVDELGRAIGANADLKLAQGIRNPTAQLSIGGIDRLVSDHGSHLIGTRFGGSGEIYNLIPGDGNLNLSAYKKLENEWANALKEGSKVNVNITPIYEGNSLRPSKIEINYFIDGIPSERIFENIAGGK